MSFEQLQFNGGGIQADHPMEDGGGEHTTPQREDIVPDSAGGKVFILDPKQAFGGGAIGGGAVVRAEEAMSGWVAPHKKWCPWSGFGHPIGFPARGIRPTYLRVSMRGYIPHNALGCQVRFKSAASSLLLDIGGSSLRLVDMERWIYLTLGIAWMLTVTAWILQLHKWHLTRRDREREDRR